LLEFRSGVNNHGFEEHRGLENVQPGPQVPRSRAVSNLLAEKSQDPMNDRTAP
jgi:hypothetical protein